VYLYGVDMNPDGSSTDRYFGTIDPDPGTPIGAVKGRWRFRPPCLVFGSVPTKPDRQCVNSPANGYLPAPREVRAVIGEPGSSNVAPTPANLTIKSANGLFYGQYHAPIGEYIFPENTPGNPIPENNFNTMTFLTSGGYSSLTGIVAGVLNPWPSNVAPPPPCTTPTVTVGGPYSVVNGGSIAISGSATGTTPTLSWAPPSQGSLSSTTIGNPVYTAPAFASGVTTAAVVNLTLTATTPCGTASATAQVNVLPFQAPIVNPVIPVTVALGAAGTINVTGSDPNTPTAKTPLTYTVTQSPVNALPNLVVTQVLPTGATVKFNGTAAASTVTLTIIATNSAGIQSAAVTTTVTSSATAVLPVANAGGPYTVTSGGKITLTGTATGTPTFGFAWTVPTGQGTLGANNTATPTYTAPILPSTQTTNSTFVVTLRVTNSAGTSVPVTANVTVLPVQAPTMNPVAAISMFSGGQATFTISGTDPNTSTAAFTPLAFSVTQSGTPALTSVSLGGGTSTSKVVTVRAPTLPANQVKPTVITLTIRVNNAPPGGQAAKTSAPITTTVTINPVPDVVTITNATYRVGQQRLILTATSSVVSPDLVLKLQPYLTVNGAIFDPATLGDTFTNGGGGLYTITVVGAPEPAIPPATPLTVKSNLNGLSAVHGLDTIQP
jgi:hypothetical protein